MRILVYGDSNTFGTGPMATLSDDPIFSKSERWAGVMADQLGADVDVIVEGLPGRTTVFDDPTEGAYRNGLRTLKAILMSHRPIDLLILKLGTNDTQHRYNLGPQDIAMGCARLVKDAVQLDVVDRILVICPAPVRERGDLAEVFKGAEQRCVGLSEQMERFASENGAEFLDAAAHVSVDDLDGVHLSAESHKILGRVVAQKVQEIMS
ncbi:MAG: GDSL-type esterase/lipase family protein [Paracoccaceae bacterium]